jgi:superfamily II DNA/RNA helicase
MIPKQGFEKPKDIQYQDLPIVLSSIYVIGIAKTGSGKTEAFFLPIIVHVMDQPELQIRRSNRSHMCSNKRMGTSNIPRS